MIIFDASSAAYHPSCSPCLSSVSNEHVHAWHEVTSNSRGAVEARALREPVGFWAGWTRPAFSSSFLGGGPLLGLEDVTAATAASPQAHCNVEEAVKDSAAPEALRVSCKRC